MTTEYRLQAKIAEIESQIEYMTNVLPKTAPNEHPKFFEGAIEAYRIALAILREEGQFESSYWDEQELVQQNKLPKLAITTHADKKREYEEQLAKLNDEHNRADAAGDKEACAKIAERMGKLEDYYFSL